MRQNILGFSLTILLGGCSHSVIKAPRRYLFLDVGANRGESITAFKTTQLYRQYPWKIVAIEPNKAAAVSIPAGHDVTVIQEAAWTYAGEISYFAAHLGHDTRNSVYEMEKFNHAHSVWPCFDFASWLRTQASVDDYVILSLDVAGAEPVLLAELLTTGSIGLIDRLYVEVSYEMLASNASEQALQHAKMFPLIESIRQRGILLDYDSVEDVIAERYSWQDAL